MKKISTFLLCTVIFPIILSGCNPNLFLSQKGGKYYFPENYSGWVCEVYNVEGAPPLTNDDGFQVLKIPKNGIIKTSSNPRTSPKYDEYFYYDGNNIREAKELKLGGGFSYQKANEKELKFFFWVSSGDIDSDYEKYVKDKNESIVPVCGPWSEQTKSSNK